MQPITATRSQYRGINAHLHSLPQSREEDVGWKDLHTAYLLELEQRFNAVLLSRGYEAMLEDSLQLRLPGDLIVRPVSDLTVRDRAMWDAVPSGGIAAPVPLEAVPATDFIISAELSPYSALTIRRAGQGQPLVWLEVLSPTNKPGGRHPDAYFEKRQRLLLGEPLILLELDFLHESAPTLRSVPSYPAGEAGSHAYRIAVMDARHAEVQGFVAAFDVDAAIPPLEVPLLEGDSLTCDFDGAYQAMFTRKQYGIRPSTRVDYAQPPPNMEGYSPADQARIRARMAAVQRAAAQGVDLDSLTEPLSTEDDSE